MLGLPRIFEGNFDFLAPPILAEGDSGSSSFLLAELRPRSIDEESCFPSIDIFVDSFYPAPMLCSLSPGPISDEPSARRPGPPPLSNSNSFANISHINCARPSIILAFISLSILIPNF